MPFCARTAAKNEGSGLEPSTLERPIEPTLKLLQYTSARATRVVGPSATSSAIATPPGFRGRRRRTRQQPPAAAAAGRCPLQERMTPNRQDGRDVGPSRSHA